MAVNKVKTKIKSKKKSLITKGALGTASLVGLTGIGLLGVKMNKDRNKLQKELDNTKANLSISDKKNMDLLKKCLLDIETNEKIYKNTIEKLVKKSENDNKIIIELNQNNKNLTIDNDNLMQKFRNLQESYEELEKKLNNTNTDNFIKTFF